MAESIIGLALTLVDVIKPLGFLLHIDDQIAEAWTSMAYVVLAFARGFLALLHAANVFTRAIVLAGWASFQLTTGGTFMGLVKLLVFLANPVLANLVGMGVMFLKANEHAADQEYDEVSREDPETFCELHPGTC